MSESVREVSGVMAQVGGSVGPIVLTEWSEVITLEAPSKLSPNQLTPESARRLARMLNHMARRIEARATGADK